MSWNVNRSRGNRACGRGGRGRDDGCTRGRLKASIVIESLIRMIKMWRAASQGCLSAIQGCLAKRKNAKWNKFDDNPTDALPLYRLNCRSLVVVVIQHVAVLPRGGRCTRSSLCRQSLRPFQLKACPFGSIILESPCSGAADARIVWLRK